jgi:hypothetical protein
VAQVLLEKASPFYKTSANQNYGMSDFSVDTFISGPIRGRVASSYLKGSPELKPDNICMKAVMPNHISLSINLPRSHIGHEMVRCVMATMSQGRGSRKTRPRRTSLQAIPLKIMRPRGQVLWPISGEAIDSTTSNPCVYP